MVENAAPANKELPDPLDQLELTARTEVTVLRVLLEPTERVALRPTLTTVTMAVVVPYAIPRPDQPALPEPKDRRDQTEMQAPILHHRRAALPVPLDHPDQQALLARTETKARPEMPASSPKDLAHPAHQARQVLQVNPVSLDKLEHPERLPEFLPPARSATLAMLVPLERPVAKARKDPRDQRVATARARRAPHPGPLLATKHQPDEKEDILKFRLETNGCWSN